MPTSCFFVLQNLFSITFKTGCSSDFLSSQSLASSEQIPFSLVFFRMRVSGSPHLYSFVSSISVNTLLLLNWKSSFNDLMVTQKGICLNLAIVNVKQTILWSSLNISFTFWYYKKNLIFTEVFRFYILTTDILVWILVNWIWRLWNLIVWFKNPIEVCVLARGWILNSDFKFEKPKCGFSCENDMNPKEKLDVERRVSLLFFWVLWSSENQKFGRLTSNLLFLSWVSKSWD